MALQISFDGTAALPNESEFTIAAGDTLEVKLEFSLPLEPNAGITSITYFETGQTSAIATFAVDSVQNLPSGILWTGLGFMNTGEFTEGPLHYTVELTGFFFPEETPPTWNVSVDLILEPPPTPSSVSASLLTGNESEPQPPLACTMQVSLNDGRINVNFNEDQFTLWGGQILNASIESSTDGFTQNPSVTQVLVFGEGLAERCRFALQTGQIMPPGLAMPAYSVTNGGVAMPTIFQVLLVGTVQIPNVTPHLAIWTLDPELTLMSQAGP